MPDLALTWLLSRGHGRKLVRLLQSEERKTATLGKQTGVGAALAEALPSGTQPRPRGSILLALARATTRDPETVSYQLSHSGQGGEAAVEGNWKSFPHGTLILLPFVTGVTAVSMEGSGALAHVYLPGVLE